MDRREFLTAAGAMAGMVLASGAAAAGEHDEHAGHHAAADPKQSALLEALVHCLEATERCIPHCIALLGEGEKSLAECLASVTKMRAVAAATLSVASYDAERSASTRAQIEACAAFCRDCAAACKKHAEKHEACRRCMESCEACEKACRAALA